MAPVILPTTLPILFAFFPNTTHPTPLPTDTPTVSKFDQHRHAKFPVRAPLPPVLPLLIHTRTRDRSTPPARPNTKLSRYRCLAARRRPSGFLCGHSPPRQLPATRATLTIRNPTAARRDWKPRPPRRLHPPSASHRHRSALP